MGTKNSYTITQLTDIFTTLNRTVDLAPTNNLTPEPTSAILLSLGRLTLLGCGRRSNR